MNRTTSFSTRTGTIARRPREIRQQLKRRLEDGDSAPDRVPLAPEMGGNRRSGTRRPVIAEPEKAQSDRR